jgi:hypothetical protein
MKSVTLVASALFLGAAFARAGNVDILTPDGIIAGEVAPGHVDSVTPKGMIVGNIHGGIVVNLSSTAVVIPAGYNLALTPYVPPVNVDFGPNAIAPWDLYLQQHPPFK